MIRLPLFLAILLFWIGCRKPVPKELYGTYQHYYDLYSDRITFYQGNMYSYNSSSILESAHDSGTFVFEKETILFTSIKSVENETLSHSKTLKGVKMIYQNDKLYSYRSFENKNGTISYWAILIPKLKNSK